MPALIEVPLVLYRLGTWTDNLRELDNSTATYLNIDPNSGIAPPAWQQCVGSVVIARKDRKPLSMSHFEAIWSYFTYILSSFGEGEGAPIKLYNRQAFQRHWEKRFAKQKPGENLNDSSLVKSPYEV